MGDGRQPSFQDALEITSANPHGATKPNFRKSSLNDPASDRSGTY
jgi:hypothetical protein